MRRSHALQKTMWTRLAFALVLAALVSACDTTTRFVCDCSPPRDKQILNVLATGQANSDVGSLDPAHVTGNLEYDIARLVFLPLITLDANLKPIDWAAQTHEVGKDGLTWTFHLRNGMKWSDGAAIDAITFAYSLNRTLDPCTRSEVARYLFSLLGAAAFHASICPAGAHKSAQTLLGSSIIAVDASTLQLKLSAPDSSFLFALTTPGAWAVPEQFITADPDHWTERLADGNGFGGNLYKLIQWDHQGHLTLATNDQFFGYKSIVQKVYFLLYRDANEVTRYYAAGEGDMAIAPLGASGDLRKLQGYSAIPALDLTYLVPNWRMAPFDDLRMRQAFALAIDRRALLHDAARETDLPTFHVVPSGLPQYNGDLRDPAGRILDAALIAAPEKAFALAQSYTDAACAGNLSACPPITFTVANAPDQQVLAQALVAQWRHVFPGLQISVRAVAPATHDQAARSSQLTLSEWSADLPDVLELLLSRLHTGGAENSGAASVPEADALLDQAASDRYGDVPTEDIMQAEQLYVTNVAWIPLAQGTFSTASRAYVAQLRYSADHHISLVTWQRAYIITR